MKLNNIKTVEHNKGYLVAVSRSGEISCQRDLGRERERYKVPYGATITVDDGDEVEAGQVVANWDPHTHPVVTEVAGNMKFEDFIDGVTVNRAGRRVHRSDQHRRTRSEAAAAAPARTCVRWRNWSTKDGKADLLREHRDSGGLRAAGRRHHQHGDGAAVSVGDVIARIPQESSKTRDITGGLPRVADLFEARKPKDPAIMAEHTGTVSFGKETKGKRRLVITDENGESTRS